MKPGVFYRTMGGRRVGGAFLWFWGQSTRPLCLAGPATACRTMAICRNPSGCLRVRRGAVLDRGAVVRAGVRLAGHGAERQSKRDAGSRACPAEYAVHGRLGADSRRPRGPAERARFDPRRCAIPGRAISRYGDMGGRSSRVQLRTRPMADGANPGKYTSARNSNYGGNK